MQQESPQSQCQSAYVTVAGARVYCQHAGSGPPMLLLHGLVGSSECWRANLDALAQHATVYALDLPNMGRSQRIEGLNASLKASAKRVVAIMDALHLPAADIVGHSHGGAIALMLAARYPRRVRRLLLFAPANPYSRSQDWMVRLYGTPLGAFLLRLLPWLPAPFQRLALGNLYGGPDRVVDSCLQDYVQLLRDAGAVQRVVSILRTWFADRARLRRALRRLTALPTLLVWGDKDYTMSLASGQRLHRRLRASELVVVPGCGHSIFEEAPDRANRILLDWLARHPLPVIQLAPQPVVPARRRKPATSLHSGCPVLTPLGRDAAIATPRPAAPGPAAIAVAPRPVAPTAAAPAMQSISPGD